MQTVSRPPQGERGAAIIMVALSIVALLAFSALVVDYGVMWVSRSQVQTAADAGALAGATARAFDNDPADPHVQAVAQAVGKSNGVWGASPDIQTTDVVIATCPPTPGMGTDTCVQVNAFRNQARGNALPIFLGALVGVPSQGVKATATARGVAANATNCLKPWAVADKWFDTQAGGWTQSATYDNPSPGQPCTPNAGVDCYVPPTSTSPGTGFSNKDANNNPVDYGYQMVLKLSNPGNGNQPLSSGWAMELDLANPTVSGSGAAYGANILGCTSDTVAIAAQNQTCANVEDPSLGCIGVRTGAQAGDNQNNANKPLGQLIQMDPSAAWTDSPAPGHVINSNYSLSPRIVPVALFDVANYLAAGYTGTNGVVRVVNIVGFFVEGNCSDNFTKEAYLVCPNGGQGNDAIVGRLVNYPGVNSPSGGVVTGAFGTIITLVR